MCLAISASPCFHLLSHAIRKAAVIRACSLGSCGKFLGDCAVVLVPCPNEATPFRIHIDKDREDQPSGATGASDFFAS
jgi:hypothetical protein